MIFPVVKPANLQDTREQTSRLAIRDMLLSPCKWRMNSDQWSERFVFIYYDKLEGERIVPRVVSGDADNIGFSISWGVYIRSFWLLNRPHLQQKCGGDWSPISYASAYFACDSHLQTSSYLEMLVHHDSIQTTYMHVISSIRWEYFGSMRTWFREDQSWLARAKSLLQCLVRRGKLKNQSKFTISQFKKAHKQELQQVLTKRRRRRRRRRRRKHVTKGGGVGFRGVCVCMAK
jgi:hypothetical protein